ncbi:CBS-domain-containing membrane protein [Actinoplanes tereljensis]|uniref:BON domain-containing protein n=1 Tax=Paractinoplanes tereljensis TaxID=571912 RepID=A0A919NT94_9ACTN|nr:CBS domain-containing protein [Actinoplanes tereljensis]GIF23372.1 hypothetical protein Ate02nite_61020 [Actinoplanes tereljensis]
MKSWTVNDVMTEAVVSVDQAASYRSMVDMLVEHRFSAVPVVDDFRRVLGVVSESDLLRKIEFAGNEEPRLFDGRRRRAAKGKAHARTAGGLMSAPAITALSGTSIAAAARKMDAEKVKRLPVTDELGRLIGVVTRGDLLKVHLRPDDDIGAELESLLHGAFDGRASGITAAVTEGVATLTGEVEWLSTARGVAHMARRVPGVVDVVDRISFNIDDTADLGTGVGFGSA